MFKDGPTDVHAEERSGQPAVVSVDLVQNKRRGFRISEISSKFPQILRSPLLYEITTVRLEYHKFRARWIPRMLTGEHKTQRMTSALTFSSDTTKMATNFSVTSYE
jgi:hypothetical protein